MLFSIILAITKEASLSTLALLKAFSRFSERMKRRLSKWLSDLPRQGPETWLKSNKLSTMVLAGLHNCFFFHSTPMKQHILKYYLEADHWCSVIFFIFFCLVHSIGNPPPSCVDVYLLRGTGASAQVMDLL